MPANDDALLPHIQRLAEMIEEEVRNFPEAQMAVEQGDWVLSVESLTFLRYRPRPDHIRLDLWFDEAGREECLLFPFVSPLESGASGGVSVRLRNSENLRLTLEWMKSAYEHARKQTRPPSLSVS